MTAIEDETLFGWDSMPGIVSVWADQEGQALIWRRTGADAALTCERERFRPWLLATHLGDLGRLGGRLAEAGSDEAERAVVQYRALDGDEGSYRYLLTARPSQRSLEIVVVNSLSC